MTRDIPVAVNELLRYRFTADKTTKAFRDFKHNEHLCPRVASQLTLLLDSYVKYDAVAYDVQGIHDLGTDILLKYYPHGRDGDDSWRAIALQVKSFDDLAKRDYLKDLRSQCLQAKDDFGDRLEQYAILLCTDAETHSGRIREVNKAFSKTERVDVFVPNYLINFLKLKRSHVSWVVDSMEKAEDVVFQAARETLLNVSPTQAGLTLALVSHRLRSDEPVSSELLIRERFIMDLYKRVPDVNLLELIEEFDDTDLPIERMEPDRIRSIEERVTQDLEALIGDLLQSDIDPFRFRVDPARGRALQALLTDVETRYEITGSVLLDYVFGLVGVLKQFGLEGEELLYEDW